MHYLIIGLLLGYGAAIPIGPVNLEIARRNIHLGFWYGMFLGLGAVLADVAFLCILSFGVLQILQHKEVLYWMNVAGSCILGWFGYQAFKMGSSHAKSGVLKKRPLLYYFIAGFSMTMVNPYTVIFWVSVSAQIANIAQEQHSAIIFTGVGVILGTASWILFFNAILHWSKRFLSKDMIQILNKTGGVILLGFSAYGFWKAFAGPMGLMHLIR